MLVRAWSREVVTVRPVPRRLGQVAVVVGEGSLKAAERDPLQSGA
jgi:hypothetical protein